MSKKDQKTTKLTWGHFKLASFAGTKSVFSSSFLKIKVNVYVCANKTYHFIKNINSEWYIAPMIFSASSPLLNSGHSWIKKLGTAGVTLTLNIITHLGYPWLEHVLGLLVPPWFAFWVCRVSFLFWHIDSLLPFVVSWVDLIVSNLEVPFSSYLAFQYLLVRSLCWIRGRAELTFLTRYCFIQWIDLHFQILALRFPLQMTKISFKPVN